ncbi:MAG: sigma-70 family RNA polymerase sigma factor [Kiritimatiellae bacterium]|nr:sigma-70 family RNA polymerase sigma factor [Kiritimatiellia bacterium]
MSEETEANEAFVRRWSAIQPRIARFVRSWVPDAHLAQDIVQEVAVSCMRKYSSFDTSRDFAAWSFGFARIEIRRHRGKRGRMLLLGDGEAVEAIAAAHVALAAELDERTRFLRECLKRLSGKTRRLLDFRYFHEMGPTQIAGRLGLSAGSVKVMLSRARASLRECIERRLARETP